MNNYVANFSVFLYKTVKEKRFHWVRNVINTVLPLFFSFILFYLASSGTPSLNNRNETIYTAAGVEDITGSFPSGLYNKLYYTPNTTTTHELIEGIRTKLFIVHDRVEAFQNEIAMEQTLYKSSNYFAIIFHNITNKLDYTIRTKNNNFKTGDVYSKDLFLSFLKDKNEYFDSGFLALQYTLDSAYIEMLTGKESTEHVEFEHFPLPREQPTSSCQIGSFGLLMSIFFTVPFTYLVLLPIVEEKASGFKEHLKIATSISHFNEISIFTVNTAQFHIMFASCFLLTVNFHMWDNVQLFVAYVLITFFIFSLMCYTFFMSAVFDSEIFATIGAPLFYFIPYILSSISPSFEHILVLFPLNAFKIGIGIFNDYKSSGHHFRWNDIFKTSYPGHETFSIFQIYIILFFSGLFFLLLYFYISNVMPGKYGTPKSYFFLFEKSYYTKLNKIDDSKNSECSTSKSQRIFEKCDHLETIVKMENLCKMYKIADQYKTVVNDVNMKIYKNQITALLGHNGAGKTTTMNILTGMIPKTSGTIVVDGSDDVNVYRTQIGFCPQHNVFLPYLTCIEHLMFFGVLRGLTYNEARPQAHEILKKVNLSAKKDEFGKNLSGGMKRKLCLANAIIGETKVLILDEPTSGLDPESRRDIWDVLLKLKKNHTIMITTHFMEEADVLGDKISIMENGEIIAFGTSLYLKNFYGSGYTLKILKKENFNCVEVMKKIKCHIPTAVRKDCVEPLYSVTLPYKYLEQYPTALEDLEENAEDLGIDTISITNTTLEEVFLNSSSEKRAIEPCDETDSKYEIIPEDNRLIIDLKNILIKQFLAILYKKFIYTKRNKYLTFTTILFPIIITFVSFMITNMARVHNYDSVFLRYNMVDNPICILSVHNLEDTTYIKDFRMEILKENIDLILLENENIEQYLINESRRNTIRYNDRIVSAIEFDAKERKLKILYNNNLLHSVGISLNIADNFLLNFYGYENVSITTKNSPSTRKSDIDNFTPLLYTEFIPFGFMLYMLIYLQLPFIEHSTEFKKLQNIPSWLYWVATYAYDFLQHLIVCLIILFISYNLDRDRVFSSSEHTSIFGTFVIYGSVQLVLIYAISQCFTNLNGSITFLSYFMIIAMCGVAGLSNSFENISKNAGVILLLHVFPDFALKNSLKIIYENQKLLKIQQIIYSHKNVNELRDEIDFLSMYQFYIMMPLMLGLLWALLLLFIENMYRRDKILSHLNTIQSKLSFKKGKTNENSLKNDSPYDDDVELENEKVEKLLLGDREEMKEYALVISKLQKKYQNFEAVKNINIAVKKGECFGLLGMNGAGKSTTFKMMTLNETVTRGEIFIDGMSCYENEFWYKFKFGYCPQVDALMGFMTSYEILKYLSWIKGIQVSQLQEEVDKWLRMVDISQYRHTQVRLYSGGTKRKLNTALAMISDPPVVFLDEPTTGVDPKSRRFVWKCVKDFQKNFQTVILTSHSMDECEALCNRLAIMAQGNLKCIGYIQKLKQKFGKGFSLMIKLRYLDELITDGEQPGDNLRVENVKREISSMFNCDLKDEHDGMLHYFVDESLFDATKWSEVFSKLNKFSKDFESIVENFSINETTLEDIFLNFKHTHMNGGGGGGDT